MSKRTFDEVESVILRVCGELYNKQRKITIKKLYQIVRKETNFSQIRIQKSIDRLIQEKIIVQDSFLYKPKILDNPTRREIYNLMMKYPSLTASTIGKELGLGNHAISWNLKIMLDFGLIKQIKIKNRSLFTPKKELDKKGAIIYYYVFKKEEIPIILRHLLNGPMDFEQLTETIDVERPKLRYYLKVLAEYGVIKPLKDNGAINFGLTPNYATVVSEILAEI